MKATKQNLQDKLKKVEAEQDELKIKLQCYGDVEKALFTEEGGDNCDKNKIQQNIQETSRLRILHEVNEAKLERKCAYLQDELRVETEARVIAEQKMIEIEKNTAVRICDLESSKDDALNKIKILQASLDNHIPLAMYQIA
eukprot:9029298-Ditylum_brightwellii.AAC.1